MEREVFGEVLGKQCPMQYSLNDEDWYYCMADIGHDGPHYDYTGWWEGEQVKCLMKTAISQVQVTLMLLI